MSTNRRLWLVIAVLWLSLAAGAANLNHGGYWYDELLSINLTRDWPTWSAIYPEQMPAFYVILRGWLALVGESEVAARWLPMLCAALALAGTYAVGCSRGGPLFALIGVMVLGSMAYFVRYYYELRPYSLLAACAALSMAFFLRWQDHQRPRDAALYVGVSIIGVYTHYFSLLIIAVQGVYWLLSSDLIRLRRRPVIAFGRSHVIMIGLFTLIAASQVPYLPVYAQSLARASQIDSFALTNTQALQSVALVFTNDSVALFIALALIGMWGTVRGKWLYAVWVLLPVIGTLFVHVFIARIFVNPRYLIIAFPGMALWVACGLYALRGAARPILIGVVVVGGLAQIAAEMERRLPGTLLNPPWREIFTDFAAQTAPDDALIVAYTDPIGITSYHLPMRYYFEREIGRARPPFEVDMPPYPPLDQIGSHVAAAKQVWWVTTHEPMGTPRQVEARQRLEGAGFAPCRTDFFPHDATTLEIWGRIGPEVAVFGGKIGVVAGSLTTVNGHSQPGQTFGVGIGLLAVAPPSLDYSLGVHVIDAAGRLVAQSDGPPGNTQSSGWAVGRRLCDYRTLNAPNVAGNYTVQAVLYDPISGERLRLPDGQDSLPLFSLRIE